MVRFLAFFVTILFVLPLHADARVEEAIRRALVDYGNGDLARFLSAFTAEEGGRPARPAPGFKPGASRSRRALPNASEAREAMRKRLAGTLRVRCLRSAGVVIESMSVDGNTATARALVAFSKTSPANRAVWMPVETRLVDLTLVAENDAWEIAQFTFAEETLADSLVAAKTREERDALLARNPRLLTPELIRALYRNALSLTNTDRPESAQPVVDFAYPLAAEMHDTGGLALLRGVSGILHRMLRKDYDAAMRDAMESLTLAESTGDPDLLARAWINLTRVRYMRGRLSDESASAARRALAYAENAEDPILLVRCLHDLAWDAMLLGDFYGSRLYAERELALIAEFADRWSGLDVEALLSDLYYDQGDFARAEFHLERGLAIGRRAGSYFTPALLARKALLLVELERSDEVPPVLEEAERLVSDIDITTHSLLHEARGRLLAREGNAADAECEMRAADALRISAGYPSRLDFEALIREELRRGRHHSAIRLAFDHYEGAYATEPYIALVPLRMAATAFRKLGEPEQALGLLEEAIGLSEFMRTRVQGNERQRALWNERARSPYAAAADLLVEMNRPELALEYAERAKSQVLVDVLLHGRAASTLTEEERRIERAHETRLAELNRARDAGRATEEEIARERAAYETFRDGIAVRHAPIRSAGIHTPSIAELSATLAPEQAFVAYLAGEDRVHIWVIRHDRFRVHSVPVARDALARKIDQATERLAERSLRFREPVRDLHALLLEPIEEELRGVRSLVIVPDGALWRVPFSALVDREQHFVAERFAVTLAPSLTTYRIMSDRERAKHPAARTLLAVSNPTIPRDVRSSVASFYRNADLGPLPHAEWETDALREIYGADRSTTLSGNRARESAVKATAAEHGILHFATHGIFDDRSPMYSRLVLARDETAGDDGYLETWEIAKLDLQAELVVLSACDTARGTVGGGEGVMGMAWSFFVAGARSTVATQWKVNSASTAKLMVAFHRQLASLGRAESLRRAQLALLRTPGYEHPFYWAPFVVIGGS